MKRVFVAMAFLVLGAAFAAGCRHRVASDPYMPPAPKVMLRDFVNQKLSGDAAFRALVEGVDLAAQAYNMASDTPYEELDEGSDAYRELLRLIDAAHDSYRRYQSWGRTLQTARFSASDVYLTETQRTLVPITGTSVFIRVAILPTEYLTAPGIVLQSIETSRGKTAVTFDDLMNPTISPDFRVYLVGDRVDITGAARKKIKRGEAEEPVRSRSSRTVTREPGSVEPTSDQLPMVPATPPAPAGGCVKDTDCKGTRICERGACVEPAAK